MIVPCTATSSDDHSELYAIFSLLISFYINIIQKHQVNRKRLGKSQEVKLLLVRRQKGIAMLSFKGYIIIASQNYVH